MRTVFVLGHANPFPGAAWARVRAHAEALISETDGVDVVGLVTPSAIARAGIHRTDGIRILNLVPGISSRRAVWIPANVMTSVLLSIVVWRLRPDVVILSVPPGPPAIGGFLGARIARAKTVLDYRDDWEAFAISGTHGRLGRSAIAGLTRWMDRIYRACDLTAAVTPPLVESLASRGVRSPRLHPNGADAFSSWRSGRDIDRRKSGFSEGDVVLVYIGTAGGYYRLDVVVQALALLPIDVRSRVRLLIVGPDEGGHLAKVQRIAAGLGISDHVRYAGVRHNPGEVMEILAAGNVGLVPYDDNLLWKTALPTKFHEYCAAGLPIVAMARPDSLLASVVAGNDLGRVVAPLDVEGLAAALSSIVIDERFRREAGLRARQLAVKYDRRVLAGTFAAQVRAIVRER